MKEIVMGSPSKAVNCTLDLQQNITTLTVFYSTEIHAEKSQHLQLLLQWY